jgi:multiple antibiotic resistance protein
MKSFLLAFIPLFVAIDPVGTLPFFLGLTQGFSAQEKRTLAFQAVVTAFLTGISFGIFGHMIFAFLGITSSDFQIAGGLLLLILSVREMFGLTAKTTEGMASDKLAGVVPLGIPLLAGPALITTVLILHDEIRFVVITLALMANLLIALVLFLFSDRILNRIGLTAPKVVAKLVAIFLAAIGVMMIRKGLEALLHF